MRKNVYRMCSVIAFAAGTMSGSVYAQQVSPKPPVPGTYGTDGSGNAVGSAPPVGTGTGADTSAGQGEEAGLGDIVVTARRVAENLQNVPVAVTAYSGAALQQQNVRALPEVANLTPGLVLTQSTTSPAAVLVQMRGQLQLDTLATLDPSVGTYVDGVYWGRAYGLNASLVDIDNFQALKGPQGTLFGRNTSGGAVLINTNDPSVADGLSGSISGTYGRFNYQNLTAVLNTPLVSDRVAARIVYAGDRRDGYATEIGTGRKIQNLNNYLVRGKLLVKATENLTLLLSGETFHSKTQDDQWHLGYFQPGSLASLEGGIEQLGAGACNADLAACSAAGDAILAQTQALGGNNPYRTWLTSITESNVRTQTYGLTGTLNTGFGAIKAVGAYRHVRSAVSNLDSDGTPVRILDSSGTVGLQDIKQWSGEVTATGQALADKLDFALGAFVFHEYGSDGTPNSSLTEFTRQFTGGARQIDVQGGDVDTKSWGVYGQGTYHISEQLSATGGLRYSSDKKALSTSNGTLLGETLSDPNAVFFCGFATGCPNVRSATFNSVSYTASIDYKPSNDLLLYLKTAKGFRAGGFSLRGLDIAPQSVQPFEPEIVYNYEVGIKSELFDRRLRINFAGYYSNTKNVQRNISYLIGQRVVTATQNAASVHIWGAEMDASLLLPAGFRLDGTAAYTDPSYAKYVVQGFDRSNEPFPFVPRWTATLSPSWQGEASFGKVSGRVDFAYQSKMATYNQGFFVDGSGVTRDATTGLPYPSDVAAGFTKAATDVRHVLVNARAGVTLKDGALDLSVWGKNLTNLKDRIASLTIPQLGEGSVRLREPRTYGVTASVKF